MSQTPGYGPHAHPPAGPMAQGGAGAAAKGMSIAVIIILVIVGLLVVGGGIMAVLAIYGTRKYVANAKMVEARNSVAMMGKDAVSAYEMESMGDTLRPGAAAGASHVLCKSASKPVPSDKMAVSGKKYMSSPSDWTADQTTPHTGFACLKFEMSMPQYYQYDYKATGDTLSAIAHGDLNGNGVFSTFELTGKVSGDRLLIAPTIQETSPDE